MNFKILFASAAIACFATAAQAENKFVAIDGSSTVFPITEAMGEEFQKKNSSIKVTVGISGTGGGFSKFCRGEMDISDASRPIKDTEAAVCKRAGIKFIELPVGIDALTVVVNKSNTWAKDMTIAELKKIWEPAAQNKINNWNQVRAGFPDMALKLYGPGTDSGTFDYFTEAVNGKAKDSRGDFQASEDDNVLVQGVAGDKGGLGYFGLAYFEENKDKLGSVSIKADDASPAVAPSKEAARNGTYVPLSRPLFIYVSSKSMEKPEVKAFVDYYLTETNLHSLVDEVGYIPYTAATNALVRKRWTDRKHGSSFQGKTSGKAIDDLINGPMMFAD